MSIIGVLSVVGYSALESVQRRTQYQNAAVGLVADLTLARTTAVTEQRSTYAVFLHSTTGAAPDRYIVVADLAGTFSLASFDPNNPATSPNRVLSDQTLYRTIAFGPTNGYGLALPAPFAAVPAAARITFSKSIYTPPYNERGAVEFRPDETLRLSDGSITGSVSLQNLQTGGKRQTVALVGQTAVVRGFER